MLKLFRNTFYTALYAFLIIITFTGLQSFSERKTKCEKHFGEVPELPLFPHLVYSNKDRTQNSKLTEGTKTQNSQSTKEITRTELKRTNKSTKAEIAHELLDAVSYDDFSKVIELITKNPFLKNKNIRFTSGSLIDRISEKDKAWAPRGWGVLQLMAYFENLKMLDTLLDLGVDIRTQKRTGGVSVESNALHIAIKKQDFEAVELILGNYNITKKIKSKGHFIDEKDQDKMTAFALSIITLDSFGQYNIPIIRRVAENQPSGNVEVPIFSKRLFRFQLLDGFELANRTGNKEIRQVAYKQLVRSVDYFQNKRKKQNNPNKRTKAPYWNPN